MSAVTASVDGTKASKKKKKNKKKANGQAQQGTDPAEENGAKGVETGEEHEEDDGSHSPTNTVTVPIIPENSIHAPSPAHQLALPIENGIAHTAAKTGSEENPAESDDDDDEDEADNREDETPAATSPRAGPVSSSDATARLDAMQQERDGLRAEVTELRKSLENLKEMHEEEMSGVKEELQQSEQSKENAETQYRNLRDKINTIRSQLGDRLKADAAELEQARGRIEELEKSNKTASDENERLQTSISKLNNEVELQSSEIDTLRNRTNTSTNNWARERDDLVRKEARIKEEYEEAKQAMQDWEILATEERSRREALEDRVQQLEEQLNGQREAYERVQHEAETQSSTVDGLQRALRDIQEERRRELREMVEQTQVQLETLRAQTKAAEDAAAELKAQLETTEKEVERTAPFEEAVREKNLLIGKLRHEAVILNDHLTKALRFLKRGKPEDNVDRQIVTNHLLHFLQLDRSDPKKFQVLQLIAALLGWDEQQREQAGLLRQGSGFATAGGSLRVPLSPFRRTPSTPQLSGDFSPISPGGSADGGGRESLAELWSDFLEREAEAGGGGGGSGASIRPRGSRTPSMASYSGILSPTSEKGAPFGRPNSDSKRKESSSALPGLGLGRTESNGGSGK